MVKKAKEEKTEAVEEKKESKKVERTQEEIEALIIDLAKQGLTPEKIGNELIKKHNLSVKAAGLKIGKILKKHNLFKDPDMTNISNNVDILKKHLEKNKHDFSTKRAFLKREAKLYSLKKYRAK